MSMTGLRPGIGASLILSLVTVGAAVPRTAAAASAAAEHPSFTGTWKLNEMASEDPREKMRGAREDRRGGPGGPGGMRGGMRGGRSEGGLLGGRVGGGMKEGGVGGPGPGGKVGDGDGDGEGDGDRPGRMGEMGRGAERLTITHEEPMLKIVDASDRERVLYTDGRKVKIEGNEEGRGEAEVRTQWKGDKKVETRRQGERAEFTQTFELSAAGQLLVKTKMSGRGPMGGFEFLRVYDRDTAEPAASASPAAQKPAAAGDGK